MKTLLFLAMCTFIIVRLLVHATRRPSEQLRSIDAIVPAYNEAPCLRRSLTDLLQNPYIARVICVNDGSTDTTAQVLDTLQLEWPGRLLAVHQANTGKGGALMHGLQHVTTAQVFLTDADTRVDPRSTGLGHLLAEIEQGADAVGGVPSSCLQGAGFLPHVRASLKLPMIVIKRSFQQWLGGAPFIVSGSCGLFRTSVLRKVGFSDRTRVEDLDMSWSLVAQGYRVRQSIRCVVYPQECGTLLEEWRRWRRWIVGYAVCMRLHRRLLLTRFGLFSILPMILLALLGIAAGLQVGFGAATVHGPAGLVVAVVPLVWIGIVMALGLVSAIHHGRPWLVPAAAFSVLYVLLAYAVWLIHGLKGLFTGREPERDKPTRYPHVVE